MTTSCPAVNMASTTWEPMKPAPPVTRIFMSVCASPAQHDRDSLQDKLQIEPDAVVADVEHIEPHAFLVSNIRATRDLPKPREAGPDREQVHGPLAVALQLGRRDNPRPDQAHI